MTTLTMSARTGNAGFADALAPFVQQPGLPFADVLDAETIERVFGKHDGLFAHDAVFSTALVLWGFLGQVLQDGKGASCSAAVAQIAAYRQQRGAAPPCGDTGDYCRARSKLSAEAVREVSGEVARELEDRAGEDWRWFGRPAKLVDGFTFTMPDTPANQAKFPQMAAQKPGLGFPIARAVAVLSLATGAIHDLAYGPWAGKQTGETALLRELSDSFDPGDVAVFDRHYCSFMTLAMLKSRGVDCCTRLHQCRKENRPEQVRAGTRLGPGDRLVTWTRPDRPAWMSEAEYERIPKTLTLRLVRLQVTDPNTTRVETLTVVTTLTDPVAYPAKAIAQLYNYRWNVELDIRNIKPVLGLDQLRCKSPEMVAREVRVTLLGYNLIRKVMATAAAVHEKQPRQLSFTLTCQEVLSTWILLSTGACRDPAALAASMLQRIARHEVANRPGRVEPRAVKRRPKPHKLMNAPRDVLRKRLRKR